MPRSSGALARPPAPGNDDGFSSGVRCRCLTLSKLIEVKRAAGRPKDLEAIAELEALEALEEG